MASRPTFIDLNPARNGASSALSTRTRLGSPSPRVQYCDGDVPPVLSPLDAFAAQSRRMAKDLDTNNTGRRRMSRLSPSVVNDSLSQHRSDRPGCFRSLSDMTELTSIAKEDKSSGPSPVLAQPRFKPGSEYIRISGVPFVDGSDDEDFLTPADPPSTAILHPEVAIPTDYFGAMQVESPDHGSSKSVSFDERNLKRFSGSGNSICKDVRVSTVESTCSPHDTTLSHSPPPALSASPAAHARLQCEFSDDDYTSSIAGSTFSYPRKLSSSSGASVPHSPVSPYVSVHARSSSNISQMSASAVLKSKSHLNFSRPLSISSLRSSRAGSPSRQQSDVQNTHLTRSQEALSPAPSSFDDVRSEASGGWLAEGSASYTYAKFSLPRGRIVSRESTESSRLYKPSFEWKAPLLQDTPSMNAPNAFPRIPTRTPLITERSQETVQSQSKTRLVEPLCFSFEFERPKTPERPLETAPSTPMSLKSTALTSSPGPTILSSPVPSVNGRGDPMTFHAPPIPSIEAEDARSTSSKSNSTIRPQSVRTTSVNGQYVSPEEHVTMGIACHEAGSLKESTYHLRIAAMQNHPMGMLLYALACRHGWGIRPNQREGVQWLRRAVDSAIVEVVDDEDPSSGNGAKNASDRRARRAQFALSVYELGMSHLNGWGVDQDKSLALRCFEIAGKWGDADALTEAGFCYAEGIGCKKDLKKAAKFYRLAESRGVSMVGNSW